MGVAEDFRPFGRVEVWECVGSGGDGGKPVVEDDMELWSDVAGGYIQDHGDCRGMFV